MIKIILFSLLAILPRAGYGETLNRTHRLGEPKRQSIHFASWLNDSTVVYCREDGTLANDLAITHVVMVHNETTTGMMNPLAEVAAIVKGAAKIFLVDSMSAFGGVPLDMAELGIDFLVSSANKCVQGVPGFGFILARRTN